MRALRLATIWAALCLNTGSVAAQRVIDYTMERGTPAQRIRGVGAELDAHFHANHVPRSQGSECSHWKQVVEPRVEQMRLHSLRVMVLPQWYEPVNDNDDPLVADTARFQFHSEMMQSVYPILQLAQRLGMPVTLVPWGAPPGSFLSSRTNGWIVCPDQHDEYAENISALLTHLICRMGYTCISEVTPGNEPDGWGIEPHEYVHICRTLHARLERDGLLRHVHLNLVDNTDQGGSHQFLASCLPHLQGIADVVNSHTYHFGYDTPTAHIIEWEEENCRLAAQHNLRHGIGEFGSNQTVGASRQRDIDTYLRGVFIVRTALALLAGGACQVSYWQLFDQYYSRHDGYPQMQQLGMWRSVKADYATEPYAQWLVADYQVRPQYYAFSLLTRLVRPQARVYRMKTSQDLGLTAALCVRNPSGQMVYIVANQEEQPLHITLRNQRNKTNGPFRRYTYSLPTLPHGPQQIGPHSQPLQAHGQIVDTIPPASIVFYTSVRGEK